MYDMNRGELRYNEEQGYYYENEIDEVSYLKIFVVIFMFVLIGLGAYKYEYIIDRLKKEFSFESQDVVVKDTIVNKKEILKQDTATIKEVAIIKTSRVIEKNLTKEAEFKVSQKDTVKNSKEKNTTVETKVEDEEEIVFFTSMGKTVDNSKIQDSYKEPKKEKNSTIIE